jgi:hypothetical protein
MENQEDINELADAIYRDRVLRARAEDPCEKLMDGFRLFEYGINITKMGVQAELGTTDEEAVMAGVQRRFDIVRRSRERGLYQPWEPAA